MNISQKLFAYIRITRPINFLLTFLSVFVAGIIGTLEIFPIENVLLACFSAALAASFGNVINDIFDIDADRLNHPGRMLVIEFLSKKEAITFSTFLSVVSLLLAVYINLISFYIVLLSLMLLFLYSYSLKKMPLLGNVVIAFLTGMAFMFGGVAVQNPYGVIIPAMFAFLINLIREIVKDMEDFEGDKQTGIFTFPAVFGFNTAKKTILLLTIILVLFTFYPFIYKIYNAVYFIIVLVIVDPLLIYLTRILFANHDKKNLNKISNILKLEMVFGLVAIYLGK